jgi:type I restriction enzyme, S subunit
MKKRVPKLRFPEFNGEWEEKNVNEILQDSKGAIKIGPFGSALKKDIYVKKGIKVFTQENIFQNNFTLGNYYVTEEKYKALKSCELEPDDIVFSMMGTIGNCAVFPHHCEKGIMNSHLLRIQLNSEINPLFFYHQYSSSFVKRQIKKLSVGSIMSGLSSSIVSNIRIDYPSTLEQQKIADFLSTVDGIIASEQHILDDLQLKKKGLMQKLFNRELRFKDNDGREFPEWEEKRLGEITNTFKAGESITAATITETGRYPVYGGNGFRGYTTTFTHDGQYVLIGRQGALCGNIKYITGENFVSEHAIAVQTNQMNNIEYLYFFLDYCDLNKLSESSAQGGLSVNKLVILKYLFPCLEEQQKIANCLSLLDNVICEQQTIVNGWKLRKKGLLQQMFM